ncbi:hypothetical protein [Flammeovirga aprica]|uniref:Uncharacterized protein n=1 Tax=Flammeovirga aprica JL-4 TaxID=694437 RepID=A0A7X9RXL1_9BACT|nr:hypothetical protein [Flammeovirga aprica]NME70590.1 hypothetical protein [Flammeovirga aprica JL-4]
MKNAILIILLTITSSIIYVRIEEKLTQKSHLERLESEIGYVEKNLSRLFNLDDYEECKNTFDSIQHDTNDLSIRLGYRVIPVQCTKDTLEMILKDDDKIIHCINGKCNIFYVNSLVELIAVHSSPVTFFEVD